MRVRSSIAGGMALFAVATGIAFASATEVVKDDKGDAESPDCDITSATGKATKSGFVHKIKTAEAPEEPNGTIIVFLTDDPHDFPAAFLDSEADGVTYTLKNKKQTISLDPDEVSLNQGEGSDLETDGYFWIATAGCGNDADAAPDEGTTEQKA